MTVAKDYNRLTFQIDTLKKIAVDYPGKTIENIISQLDARAEDMKKGNFKLLLSEYVKGRIISTKATGGSTLILTRLLVFLGLVHSNEVVIAKLKMMVHSGDKSVKLVGEECLNYLTKTVLKW